MKKIKVLIALCLFVFVFQNVKGQESQPPSAEVRAEKITEWMKKNLNLTEAQLPAIQSLNLKYAKLNDELKNSSQDKKQIAKTMKSNEKAKVEELKKLLTMEQMKIYNSKKGELKKEMGEKIKSKKK